MTAAATEIAAHLEAARRRLAEAEAADPAVTPVAIISSSYYAMNRAAKAVILAAGHPSPKSHEGLSALFHRLMKERQQPASWGQSLSAVLRTRLASDYGLHEVADPAMAEAVRDNARAFVRFCETLLD